MKTKSDARIDAYIERAAAFARPILRHFRTLIHQGCAEIEEAFKWGHPTYLYRGKMLCGTAAFKAHVTFGFWHQEMEKILNQEVGKTHDARGLLGRLTCLDDLPADATLRRTLWIAQQLYDAGVPGRSKPKARAPLPLPADFAAALSKNKAGADTFEKFRASRRCDPIEWIAEAKRDETRRTRLATALAWLVEGKSGNWKYENGKPGSGKP